MAVEYYVISNLLTSPPSYTCRPNPKVVLDLDMVAQAINDRNPTIPIQAAKNVLEAFRDEIIAQLAEGNSVKIENFVSFVVTMPVKLASPTDSLPSDPIDIKGKPSITFKEEVKQAATYARLGYTSKQPQVISASDTNTGLEYYVRNDFGCDVNGSNIGFNVAESDEGIFLTSEAGNQIKQTNISINDPSRLIFVPALDPAAQPAGGNSVEQILTVKTRYTANGTLRSTSFGRKLRTTNVIDSVAVEVGIFITGGAATAPATISSYTGGDVNRVLAKIRPDNVLVVAAATLSGDFGQELEVLANGDFILVGGDNAITVTVSDYATLYQTVIDYGRYVEEVCDLQ